MRGGRPPRRAAAAPEARATPDLFAVTAPGLEPIVADELGALGLKIVAVTPGGVEFEGDLDDLWHANLALRGASRVLLRVASFRSTTFDELRRRAARLPWERYLARGDALQLRVTCHASRLYHSGAVAERVAAAIADRLGFVPARAKGGSEDDDESGVAGPRTQLVLVRFERDRCTVSADSSGELLHRRGYREATGKAPLRETIAAALVLASGWDAQSPLVDPLCGAGTIAIEAALLARRRAPGRARRFAFMGWSDFDAARWARLLEDADARAAAAPTMPPILASDRDPGAIAAARANAARAGVEKDIVFSQRTVSDIAPPPGPGFVVTNPPHGVRLSRDADLRNLYATLGRVLRARCPGWRVALLSPGPRLWNATGIALAPRLRVRHGGLGLVLVTGVVSQTTEPSP